MKEEIRIKEVIGIGFLFLVLILSSFLLSGFQTPTQNPTGKEVEVEAVSEPSKSVNFKNAEALNEGITETLEQYYKSFFNALGDLKSQNIGQYFYQGDSESSTQGYFDQKFQDSVITIRNAQPIDLRFNNYTIDLNIQDINQISENKVEISLEENQNIVFNKITDQPSLSKVKNRFLLGYLDNKWQILEHDREEDLFVSMTEELDERIYSGTDTRTLIDQINQNRVDNSRSEIDSQKEARIALRDIIYFDNTDDRYNRENAIAYANEFSLNRNSEYPYFDDTGGNCNNFISQCLQAGGITLDYSGSNRWYYDGDYTDSWINVDYFYDYAKSNTGSGFSGIVDDNLYSGNVGDIIQYGEDGNFKHSVIISGLIKNREGETIDYLIDSNTTDRMNYPASAYGYTQFRLIKIKAN